MIKLSNASLFGPQKSILRSQRVDESSLDPFITPLYPWPTDHKGVLVTFELKEGRPTDHKGVLVTFELKEGR